MPLLYAWVRSVGFATSPQRVDDGGSAEIAPSDTVVLVRKGVTRLAFRRQSPRQVLHYGVPMAVSDEENRVLHKHSFQKLRRPTVGKAGATKVSIG